MRAPLRLILAFGLLVPAAAYAETLYVIEHLVVSVNSAPDGSGERVSSIRSGDRVELLERQDNQARIRLPSGAEGWVKASYLSPELPLRQRLSAREEEIAKLRANVSRLESELAAARAAASATATPASDPDPVPDTQAEPPRNPSLFNTQPRKSGGAAWYTVAAGSIVSLLLGFALGWRVLDRRIRRKYGGLKIY